MEKEFEKARFSALTGLSKASDYFPSHATMTVIDTYGFIKKGLEFYTLTN